MKITPKTEALAAILLAAAPAFAQASPSETVRAALEKGAVFTIQGQTYEFMPKPDASYTNKQGRPVGTYRADGKRLCVTPGAFPQEICFTYPDGKTSGDTFEVQGDSGTATVTIG